MNCLRKTGTLPYYCRRCQPVQHSRLSFRSKPSRYRPLFDIQPNFIMPKRITSQDEDVASAVESLKKANKKFAEPPAAVAAQERRRLDEVQERLAEALSHLEEAQAKHSN